MGSEMICGRVYGESNGILFSFLGRYALGLVLAARVTRTAALLVEFWGVCFQQVESQSVGLSKLDNSGSLPPTTRCLCGQPETSTLTVLCWGHTHGTHTNRQTGIRTHTTKHTNMYAHTHTHMLSSRPVSSSLTINIVPLECLRP